MKKLLNAASVLVLLATANNVSYAEDKMMDMQKGNAPKQGMKMGKGMGMMGNMTEEQRDMHMRSMQAHMLKIHDLSNQILAEKDPVKKQELKEEQLKLMKAHMSQMMNMKKNMMQSPKHKQMMQKESMGSK